MLLRRCDDVVTHKKRRNRILKLFCETFCFCELHRFLVPMPTTCTHESDTDELEDEEQNNPRPRLAVVGPVWKHFTKRCEPGDGHSLVLVTTANLC